MNTGKLNSNPNVSFAGVTNSTYFPLVEFDGQNSPTAWGIQSGHSQANVGGGLSQVRSRDLGITAVNNWLRGLRDATPPTLEENTGAVTRTPSIAIFALVHSTSAIE